MMMWPWQDRGGRLSPLKAAVFISILAPGLWLLGRMIWGDLGPRPRTEVVHEIGLWAVRFLLLSLCVTPARRIFNWPRFATVRRMLGVASAVYAVIHLGAYTVEQALDWWRIVTEIILRIYLIIGLAALVGLIILGVTSTDGMIRRLGGLAWRRLHGLVFLIAFLALVHFFMQSKADVSEPMLMMGFYAWLIGYRLCCAKLSRDKFIWGLGILSFVVAFATMSGEAIYFYLKMGIPPARIFSANFDFDLGLRPGVLVFLTTTFVLLGAIGGSSKTSAV